MKLYMYSVRISLPGSEYNFPEKFWL